MERTKKTYKPVKDFALDKGISVQAVYQGLKRGLYKGKKLYDRFQLIEVE